MANLTNLKKGDKVILRMFTGAFVEAKEIEKADKTSLSFTNKKGIVMKFSKKTGKQIEPEPKAEKFANFVEVYDEDVEAEELEKRKNKATAKKKVVKKVAKKTEEPEYDEEEDDDDYEEVDDDDDYDEEDE